MKPEDVAAYLQAHPHFFEQYSEMLADLYIPHPHGGRAIPISERQILTLRERNKHIETRLREIIRFGEENDAIGEKVHRLALALLSASDTTGLANAVHFNLREDFAVPHVLLRTWSAGDTAPIDTPLRELVEKLSVPYCGTQPPEGLAELFGESAPLLKSFSVIPLQGSAVRGMLALASEDLQRFYPEMGTVYLRRIGDMVTAALSRQGIAHAV
jgi:uncharacterized protein